MWGEGVFFQLTFQRLSPEGYGFFSPNVKSELGVHSLSWPGRTL